MDPKSMEKAMLKNMVKKTGKTIEEWVGIVYEQNFSKHPFLYCCFLCYLFYLYISF